MKPLIRGFGWSRASGRRAASGTLTFAMAGVLVLGAILPVAADTKSKGKSSGLTDDQKIIHLLNRAGYGSRPGDFERVKRMGIDKYLDLQLHPERIEDSGIEARLASFPSLRMSLAQIQEKYPPPQLLARELGLRQGKNAPVLPPGEGADENTRQEYRRQVTSYYREHDLRPPQLLLQELQGQKIIRAIYSERQLQEAMTDFWFNHFNIFWAKNADRNLTTDYEMNVIRPNTMGKFKDLLMATAKSPAMLVYLDNFQSMSPDARLPNPRQMRRQGGLQRRPGALGDRLDNPRLGRRSDAPVERDREMQREQSQSPDQMAAQQRQVPNLLRNRKPGINENYAREIMELHTLGVEGGYTQKDVQEVARCFTGWTLDRPRQASQFVFRSFMHDNGEKTVLGQRIPSGGGIKDGEKVIDILAHHPNTAKFISTKLARRFVSDTPPQSLVDRLASVYAKTDGDIREMLRTIFTSPEFNSKEAYRAKIKSPFELAVSAVRALGADMSVPMQTAQFISKMGQPLYLYQAPTGYPDRADQWVNTGALLERLNFGLALTTNKLRGAAFDVKRAAGSVQMSDRQGIMERAVTSLLNGDISSETRAVLTKQLKEGVAVKGELGGVPPIPQGDDLVAENTMQSLPPASAAGKGQKGVGNPERLERRFGQRGNAGPQIVMSAEDLEGAKIFGLVLGSPEFQRR
ncbi:MAG TPA: DUF1800 domain-containing protein [Blastocatellia bacterium]|nr:DUF1800 domain-containing protein [Blastocatellia bacterium]